MKKIIIALLFIPSLSFGACGITEALLVLRPGAEWSMKGESYEGIIWMDKSIQPTKQEVSDQIIACQSTKTTRDSSKTQAKLDVKNGTLTQAQRFQALLILLDLDQ